MSRLYLDVTMVTAEQAAALLELQAALQGNRIKAQIPPGP